MMEVMRQPHEEINSVLVVTSMMSRGIKPMTACHVLSVVQKITNICWTVF